MEIVTLTLGALGTNCYIAHTDAGTLVIDPADDAAQILAALRKRGWQAGAALLTHAHFDHMLALDGLGVERVYLHRDDVPLLRDARRNLSAVFGRPFEAHTAPEALRDGDEVMGMEVLHTPGHTPGSLCLYDWREKTLFSGDTLFCRSWGRTDFPGGDESQMFRSLDRLLGLPGESRVLPGHGVATGIQEERRALGWNASR